ncbi:MAG TPA: SAP domain-containing protein [Puia sp.]|nr:SAP domain-containing protein [Puia sp.]
MTHGAPAKIWKLDCKPCESFLSGERKAKIIKVIPGDKESGVPSRMEHVADIDPLWASTSEGIPPTPDEQHITKIRVENAQQRLQELQAVATIRAAGLSLPDDVTWLLEKNHDPRIIKGETVCANHHPNVAGSKFCSVCGISMSASSAEVFIPQIPVEKLHVNTLRKMCRDRGLPDKGTKVELVKRLTVPANVKLTTEVQAA